jgi:hypothetical protein
MSLELIDGESTQLPARKNWKKKKPNRKVECPRLSIPYVNNQVFHLLLTKASIAT